MVQESILKDFVNGTLLYCFAPPTFDQERFHISATTSYSWTDMYYPTKCFT